jgi:sensor domain CHASE-containing protein
MIKFFRKIRQNLLSENKFSKYLIYAIGEIILVVIGILIALQINNNNELNKQRAKEVQFLKNLKSDLIFEESELERYIGIRESIVNSAQIALEHFNGKPVENIQMFNYHTFNVGIWQEFQLLFYSIPAFFCSHQLLMN